MFEQLSEADFLQLARQHQRIAVYKAIPGDRLTPITVFQALQDRAQAVTLLESSPKEAALGRYSYFCFDPLVTIRANGRQVQIEQQGKRTQINADPFDVLRDYQQQLACKVSHSLAGYAGGMVGYMSYDAIRLIEDIPDRHEDIDQVPDLLFRFYRHFITFDHKSAKVIVTTVAEIADHPKKAYQAAMASIDAICDDLFAYQSSAHETLSRQATPVRDFQVDTSDSDFCAKVQQAKAHISSGDIFQVVLSRQFSVDVTAKPFDIYRAIRFSNPSPAASQGEAAGRGRVVRSS